MTSKAGNTESWKLTLPCTKAEAQALSLDTEPLGQIDPAPVLMTSEPDESQPDQWLLEAYFEGRPSRSAIDLVRTLVPSASA